MFAATKRIAAAALFGLIASIQPAQAQSDTALGNLVVVELFTSQGCSSCPPADKLLHKLAARGDVLALSMHVNYWDYIGWKDAFATQENTDRQRHYARVAGRRSVYTPQMIINGQDSVVGTHPMDVADLVMKHRADRSDVSLSLQKTSAGVTLTARAKRPGSYDITLVRFDPKRSIKIKRGENAGKNLTYANVVSDLDPIAKWDGRNAIQTTIKPGKGAFAVIVQRAGFGAIEAAAMLR